MNGKLLTSALLCASGLIAAAQAADESRVAQALIGPPMPVVAPSSAATQPPPTAHPLETLRGRWTGTGIATLSNGRQEPFNCVATYVVAADNSQIRQTMRCESAYFKVSTAADIIVQGNTLSGSWIEKNYETAGQVTGTLQPNGVSAIVTHKSKQARVDVAAHACDQTVVIAPKPGELVRAINANLKRC
jgi:hypothetical protein